MDLSLVKGFTIPEGNVTKLAIGTMVLWEKVEEVIGGLPKSYQRVEWIGNDNNKGVKAYIDLGFAFDTKARIEMGQYIQGLTTAYAFGSAENGGKLRCMLTSPNAGASNCILYGSTGSAYISMSGVTISENVVNDFVFTFESGKLHSINNTTGSEKTNTSQASYAMTNNLHLFSQNYNGASRISGITRIAYFRYYDKNDNLICDLIPCYRKGDGVIGMYDVVRNTFLESVTNYIFEKGADVTE